MICFRNRRTLGRVLLSIFLLGYVFAADNGVSDDLGFRDDFNIASSNWVDDGSGRWSVTGGAYVMTGVRNQTWAVSLYDTAIYSDFTYASRMRRISGEGYSLGGLALRANSQNEGYRFVIALPDFYSLWEGELTGGSEVRIIGWTRSAAINGQLGAWNTLKVEVSGEIIKLYMNGVLLNTVTDSSYSSGKVGLVAYDYSNMTPPVVEYDFAEVIPIGGTAIPEPTTMLFLGSGLIGLAGYGRRKFRGKR